MASKAAHKSHVLGLYRRILTLHKRKLDPRMRVLGDAYVRDEFRRHKDAAAKFVPLFLQEWEQYATVLSQKDDQFGRDLAESDRVLLNDEQREKLQSLKDAAKTTDEEKAAIACKKRIELAAKNGDPDSALEAYAQMKRDHLPINPYIQRVVINMKRDHLPINPYIQRVVINVCASAEDAVGQKEAAFAVYNDLVQALSGMPVSVKNRVDESVYSALIKISAKAKDYGRCAELLEKMTSECVEPRLRTFSPLLVSYCSDGNLAKGLWVRERVHHHSIELTEPEYVALFDACISAESSSEFYRLLEEYIDVIPQPTIAAWEVFKRWFARLEYIDVIPQPTIAAWEVFKRWFASNGARVDGRGWTCTVGTVDEKGVSSVSGDQLVSMELPEAEETALLEKIVGLVRTDEKRIEQWAEFTEWLTTKGPFDIIIDAANVGYFNRNFDGGGFSYRQIQLMLEHYESQGKKVLVVLHKRRTYDDQRRTYDDQVPEDFRPVLASWKERNIMYNCRSGNNDDWYWLYAAVKLGGRTLVVTNDEMRDHHFQMIHNRSFGRWKERHQVHYTIHNERRVKVQEPRVYSARPQQIGANWHFPLADSSEWLKKKKSWRGLRKKEQNNMPVTREEEEEATYNSYDDPGCMSHEPIELTHFDSDCILGTPPDSPSVIHARWGEPVDDPEESAVCTEFVANPFKLGFCVNCQKQHDVKENGDVVSEKEYKKIARPAVSKTAANALDNPDAVKNLTPRGRESDVDLAALLKQRRDILLKLSKMEQTKPPEKELLHLVKSRGVPSICDSISKEINYAWAVTSGFRTLSNVGHFYFACASQTFGYNPALDFFASGGMQLAVFALQKFVHNEMVLLPVLDTIHLYSKLHVESAVDFVAVPDAIEILMKCVRFHDNKPNVISLACHALGSLVLNDLVKDSVSSPALTLELLRLLRRYSKSLTISRAVLAPLAFLVTEAFDMRLLYAIYGFTGIPRIVEALASHLDTEEVAVEGFQLVAKIAQVPESYRIVNHCKVLDLAYVALFAYSGPQHRHTRIQIKTAMRAFQSDVWNFISGPLHETLFAESWPNGDRFAVDVDSQLGVVGGTNILLGGVQLRMLRVQTTTCQPDNARCFPSFSLGRERKTPVPHADFTERWSASKDSLSPANAFVGRLGTYPNHGFRHFIPRLDRKGSQAVCGPRCQLETLRRNDWIDASARALFIEFNLYNAAADLHVAATILFEFTSVGGVLTTTRYTPIALRPYAGFFLAMPRFYVELALVLGLLWFILKQVDKLMRFRMHYFIVSTHLVDFVIVVLWVVIITTRIQTVLTASHALLTRIATNNAFTSLNLSAYLARLEQDVTAWCACLMWWRLLRLGKCIKRLETSLEKFERAELLIESYLVLLALYTLGFAQSGVFLFSTSSSAFRTLGVSLTSMAKSVLNAGPSTGAIAASYDYCVYHIVFRLCAAFVVLNLIVAILRERFSHATNAYPSQLHVPDGLSVVDLAKRQLESSGLPTTPSEQRGLLSLPARLRLAATRGIERLEVATRSLFAIADGPVELSELRQVWGLRVDGKAECLDDHETAAQRLDNLLNRTEEHERLLDEHLRLLSSRVHRALKALESARQLRAEARERRALKAQMRKGLRPPRPPLGKAEVEPLA
ncbi:hypothetical protein P43SY_006351 [Pythium insidiosum]|uniref:Mitochondrial ribonuclease P catalytic subunit n=1 Tax=Pythium insidiosum TaxID=114742 RepID=A0AAD5M0R0_PYTIN|nr:hypothetical protein P43SY_006351 [Pythium insidiosum]